MSFEAGACSDAANTDRSDIATAILSLLAASPDPLPVSKLKAALRKRHDLPVQELEALVASHLGLGTVFRYAPLHGAGQSGGWPLLADQQRRFATDDARRGFDQDAAAERWHLDDGPLARAGDAAAHQLHRRAMESEREGEEPAIAASAVNDHVAPIPIELLARRTDTKLPLGIVMKIVVGE